MPSDNVQGELQYVTILPNTIGNTSYLVAQVVDITQTYVYTGGGFESPLKIAEGSYSTEESRL